MVSSRRIGLIGGLSWESTASYYRYFHEFSIGGDNEWSAPNVLIDSIDFGLIVPLQREGDWNATGVLLADSARRLERAGATVLGIGANSMHINFEQVVQAVQIPVVDVRVAVANEALARSHKTIALLGTKYLLEGSFYSDRLAELGLSSLKPTASQIDRLQEIIFQELTKGAVTSGWCRKTFDVTYDTALRDLSTLVEMGLLARVGSGRTTRYELKVRTA